MGFNLGKMFQGLVDSIFGGYDSGGSPPVFLMPPTPAMPVFSPDVSHNSPIDSARSDAAFQVFLSAMNQSLNGKTSATLNGFESEDHSLSFGHMHDVTNYNPDGSSFVGSQFDAFASLSEHSEMSTYRDTSGGYNFGGSSYWSGNFDQYGYNPRDKVVVMEDHSFSSHNEVALVGIWDNYPVYDVSLSGVKG